ncbi:hypothetical protein AB0G60_09410 [Streptomyces angustmyceticus]|uniref:Lipoprotein n=1 Tax=Streptomyces angustmyceticus TaxID=285578 RepID=A0A5J4LK04_9ACTN|nr:hypothetical protein [Streptomyces angustmyceticus]UAL67854.1 hypothetical protein K7396_16085 [Streptomyces angustmyceticus]GES31018.1 hypothetical protein San01_35050 [Streptomyces angustmyceticus]
MNRTTNPTRRHRTAIATALACAAALGTLATAHAANAAAPSAHTAHQARAAHTAATPYVINHYGEENADKGRAERRPAHLVLSEFTSAGDLHWKQWGAKKAVATGEVTGNWCLDTCLDKPLKATLTLSAPKAVHGRKVFSSFTLKLAGGSGKYDAEDLQGKRPLATG